MIRAVLKLISRAEINVKKYYRIDRMINNLLHLSFKPRFKMWDHEIMINGYDLPVRLFAPKVHQTEEVILFFHGGGWVSGTIDSYTKICAHIANTTGRRVLSVDYRRAPEYPFPYAVEDCYQAARELFLYDEPLEASGEKVVLMGDSAGASLAAAVSLMAVDRGEFQVEKQILLYPSTYNDHSEASPFRSITENGTDYLLTSKKIQNYQDLYVQNKEDRNSPYFAPLLSDHLEGQPKTLLITAELDPLRDEGEAYGEKLKKFGNDVAVYRIKDALHGFFSFSLQAAQVKQCYQLINLFLKE
jgi:acetyl esterase/lipase